MINQIVRLHYKDILLLILFIPLKIFSLTTKMSPINLNIFIYFHIFSIFTWLLNIY